MLINNCYLRLNAPTYSLLRLFTGLAIAALTAFRLTVIITMPKVIKADEQNTYRLKSVL